VITIPGISFGQCGEGYVRIACTVGIDALEEAFNRYIKLTGQRYQHHSPLISLPDLCETLTI
jgi:hypothetical protein